VIYQSDAGLEAKMSDSPTRQKSPPYPSLSLKGALERAEQLREVAKGFAVPMPSAAKAWGYSPTSSSVISVVGALNQFGLLEEAGAGDAKRVKVSSLGEAILLDKRPNSNARSNSIKKAALTPKVFMELWEQFKTSEVDEHTLIYELTLGRAQAGKAQYTEQAARDVAVKYVESLRFAGLDREGNGTEQTAEPIASEQHNTLPQEEPSRGSRDFEASLPPIVVGSAVPMFEEKKALDEGTAILIWPRQLSADSVEDMEYWLQGVLRQIKRRVKNDAGGAVD
jgi:hypothetical protein